MTSDKRIIIAIDGYAACGKSTLAKALAKALSYGYVDSGAMYRAVTLYFLENGVDYSDAAQVAQALPKIKIRFKNVGGRNTTFLNGENVEQFIREMRVSNEVSPVSAVSAVRRALVKMQQDMGKHRGIVMDGRDIGTVVFPDAELKLFMTASPEVRTTRRMNEILAQTGKMPERADVQHNLLERDRIDSTRQDSPLKQADDAVVIDNSDLSPEEQFDLALNFALDIINQPVS